MNKMIITLSSLMIFSLIAIAQDCDLSNPTLITETYYFEGNFSDFFTQTEAYPSYQAAITQVNGSAQLSTSASATGEAWIAYNRQMPYDKSWDFSATITIPNYWYNNGGNNGQVGFGIFAGIPVPNDISCTVYECNMAVVKGDLRFVQAQLIENRCGEDPVDVQFMELDESLETAVLKLEYCATTHRLRLFIDGQAVGEGHTIDETGIFNWGLSDSDRIDIGLIGFSEEGSIITSNHLTADNIVANIYDSTTSANSVLEENNQIFISPNPANDELRINSFGGKIIENIKIYDLHGNLIYAKSSLNTFEAKIPFDNLPKGVYLVQTNNSYITKLIKN